MPAKVSDAIVSAIEDLWGEHPEWSGRAIWDEYKKKSGGRKNLSLRKVQDIVKTEREKAKERGADTTFPLIEWGLWGGKEAPEDTGFFLHLDALFLANLRRHIYRHEAQRAKQLRVVMQDMNPAMRFFFILEYGTREVVATNLGRLPARVGDLDGLLTFKPWLPDKRQRETYRDMVATNHFSAPPYYDPFLEPELDEGNELRHLEERLQCAEAALQTPSTLSPWERLTHYLGLESEPPVQRNGVIAEYPFLKWLFARVFELWEINALLLSPTSTPFNPGWLPKREPVAHSPKR